MGGAFSCCLPCAGSGVPPEGPPGPGGLISSAPCGATVTNVDKALNKQQHPRDEFDRLTKKTVDTVKVKLVDKGSVALDSVRELYLVNIDEQEDCDSDDDRRVEREEEDEEEGNNDEDEFQVFNITTEQDGSHEAAGQHRLSPRLHDIEEEDDEDCRYTCER